MNDGLNTFRGPAQNNEKIIDHQLTHVHDFVVMVRLVEHGPVDLMSQVSSASNGREELIYLKVWREWFERAIARVRKQFHY